MNKYYYKKSINVKKTARFFGLGLILLGVSVMAYIFFPLAMWQLTMAPVFASQGVNSPIPKATIVSPFTIQSLVKTSIQSIATNYNDANSWFPNMNFQQGHYAVDSYTLSIPSIGINNAVISTTDTDLGKHMVQMGGSALPPAKGTAIIFGHSTLPQLFDPSNYHTILANAYKIKVGDDILVTVDRVTYTYKIFSLVIVDPDNTSVLIQQYDDSYLSVITCTPPGTVWERLVIKAKLVKI